MIFRDLKKIDIISHLQRGTVNKTAIQYLLSQVIAEEKVEKGFISVCLCHEQEMIQMHQQFLGENSHTDVMAFPYLDEEGRMEGYLGDILVSIDMAKIQANQLKEPFEKEVCLYCIHGLLHLIGYDDHEEQDIKKMREKENHYLSKSNWVWQDSGGWMDGN